MKYIVLTILFISTLFAQDKHPDVYASLGNEIYDNVVAIEKLPNIKNFSIFKEKIEKYVKAVAKTKAFGYQVASGARSNVKLDYLQKLREHKKINDYFLRSVQSAFQSSIDTKDNELFIATVNSGLLNTDIHRNMIMRYYNANASEIDPKGIIQVFLDEDSLQQKKRWKPKTKAQLQEEKIKRLRENDRLEKEALERKLSEELRLKKEKIRQEQERELFH